MIGQVSCGILPVYLSPHFLLWICLAFLFAYQFFYLFIISMIGYNNLDSWSLGISMAFTVQFLELISFFLFSFYFSENRSNIFLFVYLCRGHNFASSSFWSWSLIIFYFQLIPDTLLVIIKKNWVCLKSI